MDPITRSEKKFSGKVLVVDDNIVALKLIEKMLVSFGVATYLANSGGEALSKLKAEGPFDLVFLDCTMPGLNGYEVAKQIRNTELKGSRLPIVAFTADDTIENRRKCRDAGMDDFFAKPYSYTSLEGFLTRFLKPSDDSTKL